MKPTAIAVLVAAVFIGGAIFYSGSSKGSQAAVPAASNVSDTGGMQVVEIGVKGGYTPQLSVAKSGMPTVLRMKTKGTFDCSSGVVIPSLAIRQILPASGDTDIQVPAQKSGTTLEGVCVMGMYHFTVNFN